MRTRNSAFELEQQSHNDHQWTHIERFDLLVRVFHLCVVSRDAYILSFWPFKYSAISLSFMCTVLARLSVVRLTTSNVYKYKRAYKTLVHKYAVRRHNNIYFERCATLSACI